MQQWPSAGPQLQGQRVPGSKPDFTDDPWCMWANCMLNLMLWVKHLEKVWRGACQLWCHPCYLTMVHNYEVHAKIALLLIQNGTLT
ncbi:hypothetical protein AVEN_198816-1 [Araneus ventricosus]|uniref:Uncharacterized protein n=1 Tax=Araneus ventricosus TaxID=182803 RepID=A0A4Y2HSF9_ARAVE|nr:hypothetical protein AVEN_198816-1 [Araneus ventricosus]